jgi:hypothetical protein
VRPRLPHRVLDNAIRDALVPVLKEDGYRRSAHTFRRQSGSRTQVVNAASAWERRHTFVHAESRRVLPEVVPSRRRSAQFIDRPAL